MKWSQYDLNLREWCIKNNKPIPGKPEVYYGSEPSGDYSIWGKNYQPLVRFKDCKDGEYWDKVHEAASKNLDKLKAEVEDCT